MQTKDPVMSPKLCPSSNRRTSSSLHSTYLYVDYPQIITPHFPLINKVFYPPKIRSLFLSLSLSLNLVF